MKTKLPTFWHERRALSRGYNLIVGVDEVGRGALAGPVVAGAVAFKKESFFKRMILFKKSPLGQVDDSKRLSPKKREELAKVIKKHAIWGIGEVGPRMIDKLGVVKATEKAMRQAVNKINKNNKGNKKTFVLVDAFHVKYIPGVGLANQKAIVKGDQKVLSIAAASIIAKVYRDKLTYKLYKDYKRYKCYKWNKNKGYGTREHIKAIKKYGLTKHHRLAFVKNII